MAVDTRQTRGEGSTSLFAAADAAIAELHAAVEALKQDRAELRQRIAELEQRAIETQRWPEWMPVSTAAAYCGRSSEWLRERIRDGSVPVFVPEGTVERMVRRGDLDRYMAGGHRQKGAA